ncbi:RtcB family protein [Anaeromyxobacter sp. SG17]|uniref:RtcB family protein n=1 Tax=Anaeromyxobacter sp. SG17 TaxID=2925405 RepID=UPI001F5602BE|nr:RtcB family protein [Anaeromyxobacter sp. SG17]
MKVTDTARHRYGISVPDRQLACVPLSSPEGRRYFGAMCAAVNFAFCNREVIGHRAREVFRRVLRGDSAAELRLGYDVAHNTAKIERHDPAREQLLAEDVSLHAALGGAPGRVHSRCELRGGCLYNLS